MSTLLLLVLLLLLSTSSAVAAPATTSSSNAPRNCSENCCQQGSASRVPLDIWGCQGELWNSSGALSDWSFAGYGAGLLQIPNAPVTVDVKRDFQAAGDGTADDTTAVLAALKATQQAGGVIYFPPGRYLLSKPAQPDQQPGAAGCWQGPPTCSSTRHCSSCTAGDQNTFQAWERAIHLGWSTHLNAEGQQPVQWAGACGWLKWLSLLQGATRAAVCEELEQWSKPWQ
ncbi:hypothetical protein COO60DRAFT_1700125 [Scenedesmus sp. NREL 46B-D3]|nr:hypothetical protein COO60DRAFT_1700125 [Scenedesmus sp. NREL 46B-D3]